MCNAYTERFVREARETLDRMIVFGRRHLRYIVKRVESHHNTKRPHQGIDNMIPLAYEYPDTPSPPDEIGCEE